MQTLNPQFPSISQRGQFNYPRKFKFFCYSWTSPQVQTLSFFVSILFFSAPITYPTAPPCHALLLLLPSEGSSIRGAFLLPPTLPPLFLSFLRSVFPIGRREGPKWKGGGAKGPFHSLPWLGGRERRGRIARSERRRRRRGRVTSQGRMCTSPWQIDKI